ncbi:hypothetical protein E4U31_006163 [Claviceps sp. LM219 group G6]|nr:hypothetical protein E4U31_006163 [Claviceps sp. LM219 group G6]
MIMSRQATDRQEVAPSEATHGSKSLVDRYATIEAALGAEFRDAHQAIRLGARRAGLCAPLKDVDNEDEGRYLGRGLAIGDGLAAEETQGNVHRPSPKAAPLVVDKLVKKNGRALSKIWGREGLGLIN